MKRILTIINNMCLPAQIYLAISSISILGMLIQNIGQQNRYCIGSFHTQLPCHNMSIFLIQILYVLIYTWMLQKLCKKGYSKVSWLLVMFPYIFMLASLLFMILLLNNTNAF